MSPSLRWLSCVVAAALYVAPWPPWNAWPLGLVAFAPLCLALDGVRPRHAMALGALFGGLVGLMGFSWMGSVLGTFVNGQRPLAMALTFGFFAIFAARFAVVGGLVAYVGGPLAPVTAFPAALVVTELATAPVQPWLTGYGLHAVPPMAQAAALGGTTLLSAALAGTGVLLARAFAPAHRARRWSSLLAFFAIPVALYLVGFVRARFPDERPIEGSRAAGVSVGLVQGNVPPNGDPSAALEAHRAETTTLLRRARVDLVVWPETAVRGPLDGHDLERQLRDKAGVGPGGPPALLTGLLTQRETGLYNEAALLVAGALAGTYAKVDAMPLGEELPLGERLPWLYTVFPNAGRIDAAPSAVALGFRSHRVLVRICYEEMLPGRTRRAVRDLGAELLVGLANDAWFGPTPAASFHAAAARLRAIETGRYLVHAVNNGPSTIIDPRGEIVAAAPAGARASAVGTVFWRTGLTPYVRYGEAPVALGLVLFTLLAVASPRLRTRSASQSAAQTVRSSTLRHS